MSYVLGYITADGCITVSKGRKNPFTLNITSIEKKYLCKIRKAFASTHKISKKPCGRLNKFGYQLQFRNTTIIADLLLLGITPRKTYNLAPIKVPDKYFADFTRGLFDGDGTVYIYKVNNTPQIKVGFVSASLPFLIDFNQHLCKMLNIPIKNIKKNIQKTMPLYSICFYIDDCKKLNQFMYKNNPTLFLPRKQKIFNQWQYKKRRKYIKQNYPSKINMQSNSNNNISSIL